VWHRGPFWRGEVPVLSRRGAKRSNKRAPAFGSSNASPANIAIDQTVENFNKMDLTKGTLKALDHGADAAILPSIKRYVTKGPDFDIWIAPGQFSCYIAPPGARRFQ
jgi:hypothetical protein